MLDRLKECCANCKFLKTIIIVLAAKSLSLGHWNSGCFQIRRRISRLGDPPWTGLWLRGHWTGRASTDAALRQGAGTVPGRPQTDPPAARTARSFESDTSKSASVELKKNRLKQIKQVVGAVAEWSNAQLLWEKLKKTWRSQPGLFLKKWFNLFNWVVEFDLSPGSSR